MKTLFKVRATITAKYEGLTKDKIYTVYGIKQSKCCPWPLFLIYTDNQEWKYWQSNWFTPYEKEGE